jgi:hypothetical protein
MTGRLVCPACGTELEANLASRDARCPACQSRLEPSDHSLPRLRSARRPARPASNAGWAWVVIAVAAGVILVLVTYQVVRLQIRASQRRSLETLLIQAEADQRAGALDRALDRLTAALQLARTQRLLDPARLETLDQTRADLESRHQDQVRRVAEAQADSALQSARQALQTPRPDLARVLDACEAAYQAVQRFSSPRARELATAAQALAASLIRERGVDLPEPEGIFLDPSQGPATYRERIGPILVQHLEGRGYVPSRPDSPLASLWPTHAPRRLVARIEEARGKPYMESVLRTSRLSLRLELEFAGQTIWSTQVTGQTREPAPKVPYPVAAVYAVARKRDPDAEKRLYEDALDHLTGLLPTRLANLPPYAVVSPGR